MADDTPKPPEPQPLPASRKPRASDDKRPPRKTSEDKTFKISDWASI